jgi:streptomycin 6-kinase
VIELPPVARQRVARLGDAGARWLSELPGLVNELERRWAFTTGAPLTGGTAAYVARARTADGRDAVLKVTVPAWDDSNQARTIAAADGRGYVRLLAYDLDHSAMLQEALGPSLADAGRPPEQVIATLCATLREAWKVPREAVEPRPEKAAALAEMVERVWTALDQPLPRHVVDRALTFADRRARASDTAEPVVVHGDPHPANLLHVPEPREGAESGYVFVDPDGFLADPAYDLGVVLRDWCPELLAAADPVRTARRYCHLLAKGAGVDETAIWEWGFLERVSSALHILELGADDLAAPFLATAKLLAEE